MTVGLGLFGSGVLIGALVLVTVMALFALFGDRWTP